jgi:hypothetical protein
MFPSGHGFIVDRLPYLSDTCRSYGTLLCIKLQYLRVPIQSAEVNQISGVLLRVCNKIFIVDIEYGNREVSLPMLHASMILGIGEPNIFEVKCPGNGIRIFKSLEII